MLKYLTFMINCLSWPTRWQNGTPLWKTILNTRGPGTLGTGVELPVVESPPLPSSGRWASARGNVPASAWPAGSGPAAGSSSCSPSRGGRPFRSCTYSWRYKGNKQNWKVVVVVLRRYFFNALLDERSTADTDPIWIQTKVNGSWSREQCCGTVMICCGSGSYFGKVFCSGSGSRIKLGPPRWEASALEESHSNSLLRRAIRNIYIWAHDKTIFSTVFQQQKIWAKSSFSMSEAALFPRKLASQNISCWIRIQIRFRFLRTAREDHCQASCYST